jgi:hypothetical protein
MKFQVPKFLVNQPIELVIINGIDANGNDNEVAHLNLLCRMEGANKTIYTSQGQKCTISKRAYIFQVSPFEPYGDKIFGYCLINGNRQECPQISILRNTDGSINHIEVDIA